MFFGLFFSLSIGKPDNNSGSLGCMCGCKPTWVHQHWRAVLNLEEDKDMLFMLDSSEKMSCAGDNNWFSALSAPLQSPAGHDASTGTIQAMLSLSLSIQFYLPLWQRLLWGLKSSYKWQLFPAWNLRRSLTAAFCAQSLNKENKSYSENLLFCWKVGTY